MPMKLGFIFAIADKIPESMRKALIDEPFTPQPAAALAEGISVMEQVKRKDVLLLFLITCLTDLPDMDCLILR